MMLRNQKRSKIIRTTRCRVRFRSQRFLTVRTGIQLGNGEDTTKIRPILGCRFTEYSKSAWMLAICDSPLLKSGALRQEKTSHCNGNGATADTHLGDLTVCEG